MVDPLRAALAEPDAYDLPLGFVCVSRDAIERHLDDAHDLRAERDDAMSEVRALKNERARLRAIIANVEGVHPDELDIDSIERRVDAGEWPDDR